MATKTTEAPRLYNTCNITVRIQDVKVDAKPGNLVVSARAYMPQGKDKATGEYKESFWLTLMYAAARPDELTEFVSSLNKGEQVDVEGALEFQTWTGKDEQTHSRYVLWLTTAAMHNGDELPHNRVRFSTKVYNPDVRYTNAGKPMISVRARVGQGKDAAGEYKPAMWLGLKHVADGDEMDDVITLLNDQPKGGRVSVNGRLAYETWNGEDGAKHESLLIWVAEAKAFEGRETETTDDAEPV